jgi:hypothetical protein
MPVPIKSAMAMHRSIGNGKRAWDHQTIGLPFDWPETGFEEVNYDAVPSGLLATRRLKNARSWRKIAISLIDPRKRGILSVMAWLHHSSRSNI